MPDAPSFSSTPTPIFTLMSARITKPSKGSMSVRRHVEVSNAGQEPVGIEYLSSADRIASLEI